MARLHANKRLNPLGNYPQAIEPGPEGTRQQGLIHHILSYAARHGSYQLFVLQATISLTLTGGERSMLFLMYFSALLALAAFGGILCYYFMGDKLRAGACFAGFLLLAMFSIAAGDKDAVSRGFKDHSDMLTAQAAGLDANQWAALKQRQADEKRASDALDAATTVGRQAVIAVLKDPWSASIQADRAHVVGSHVVVCGTVNAKNGFGAYTGAKLFAVHVDTGSVVVDGMDGAAAENWQADCG